MSARGSGDALLAVDAKHALEKVCSGAQRELAPRYYSPTFVDHVNDLEFRGLSGVEQSVGMYRKLLADVTIEVRDQLSVADRVTSRFVVSGTSLGRRVRFNGITISRFENGLIVEDWSVIDTLGMLRQLGILRAGLVAFRALGALSAVPARSS